MRFIIGGSVIFCAALRVMLNSGEADNYLAVIFAILGLSLALRGVAVLTARFLAEARQ